MSRIEHIFKINGTMMATPKSRNSCAEKSHEQPATVPKSKQDVKPNLPNDEVVHSRNQAMTPPQQGREEKKEVPPEIVREEQVVRTVESQPLPDRLKRPPNSERQVVIDETATAAYAERPDPKPPHTPEAASRPDPEPPDHGVGRTAA